MHDLAPWIWSAGGDFCSAEMAESILNTPESIRGCEYYFDLINNGFMPIPDTALPGGNFFSGHYAMQFSGSWPAETLLNPTSQYYQREVAEGFAVTMYPSGPKGRFTFLGGSNLAVTSACLQKDLAWEFVRFITEPSRQLSHARAIGAMTARLASLDALFERYPEAKKVFWDSFAHARRLPRLVELGSVEQIIYKMSSHILGVIARGQYNHRRLTDEIAAANNGIAAVLSLHRYGARPLEKAS
jgi:multiple sugar transport system substrate-binding protein